MRIIHEYRSPNGVTMRVPHGIITTSMKTESRMSSSLPVRAGHHSHPAPSSHQAAIARQHAFSLVELSIVLVILGLLTGGILAGQSLIRAAELRSITADYNRYVSAIRTFRDKYMALPGDMTNAQSFWGVAHATPATCVTTSSTTSATCNGDGDGTIDESTGSNEPFRYWQHLANAGLIEGTYTGVTGSGTNYSATYGTNTPAGKISSSGWMAYYYGTVAVTSTQVFEGNYDNVLVYGGTNTSSFGGNVANPSEMWGIDTKIDDGKPGIGGLRTYEASSTCHDAGTSAASSLAGTANYNLTSSTIACPFIFVLR